MSGGSLHPVNSDIHLSYNRPLIFMIIGVQGGGGAGGEQVPPQFGKKNDLFGQILILFGQLSSVLKFIKGAFECCPKIY